MTQAGKVAEIFSVAGEAFTKLGKLAMALQPSSERPQDGGKWGDEEIEMLKKAVLQFGNDIEKISEKIKTKSAMQIKSVLKQKTMQNLTNEKVSTVASLMSQFNKTPIKVQTVQQRVIGQKSKFPEGPVLIAPQPQKKTKVDIPVNMNLLTAIPQMKTVQVQQNQGVMPLVASSQGFQVILPQPNVKTVQPIMQTSIPSSSIKLTISATPPIMKTAVPVSTAGVKTLMQTMVPNNSLPFIKQTAVVQKIDNMNTTGNVDIES